MTAKICNCVEYHFVRHETERICTDKDYRCVLRIRSTLTNEDSVYFKSCNCLPGCNSIDYELIVVNERLATTNLLQLSNYSLTSVYFADDEYVGYKRFANFEAVEFLSKLGGFLGLFLGVSIMSAVEFLYFFTLRFFDNLWLNNAH